MIDTNATSLRTAIREAETGNALVALMHLEKVPKEQRSPLHMSYLGYCLAKEHKEITRGLKLCKKALEDAPRHPDIYLNFARVCLAGGHKRHAIKVLRQGLKVGRSPRVVNELKKLGVRNRPVFPSLRRDNPLNKHLGLLLCRMGLR